ncbi:hypothetical protein BDV25DRAFT_168101 [Aspergillus avenaceus]|uniref:DUF1308 domain-containing protein n=1 Tax=Aspergillus avenaceus TaxID=36643 RepID=A0A5N6TS25_ASPAV|nr:hypothetical protein BDV25DRAFT_168101 [Aspergillus avenaceus]
MEDTKENDQLQNSQTLAESLVGRCHGLLAEIDAFQEMLVQTQRNPQMVEVRSLRSNVFSETRTLEKVKEQVEEFVAAAAAAAAASGGDEEIEPRLMHALRSSNLPFYETVWNIAKTSCSGLVAFGKRFYWDGVEEEDGGGGKGKKRPGRDKRKSVFVDIVADDGEEWVKVSTISGTRLLFEMAKKGWEADSESDAESGDERTVLRNDEYSDDDDDELELVKLASDMRKAADCTRVRYRHARLRLVVPKIDEGESREIDELFKIIRGYGITVECGECTLDAFSYGKDSSLGAAAKLHLQQLLPTPFKHFTSTLNVDCTLLLALVSDLSHIRDIVPSPDLHKAIIRQLEVERERPLLNTELWPAMGARELLCTEEAAQRMREIVDTIGTETEKRRTELLLGAPPFNSWERDSILQKFQELSDNQVPADLKLPIKIVEAKAVVDSAVKQDKLPEVSSKVAQILSDINHSVFFYGWASRITTISSNRTVVKQVEAIVEQHRNGDEQLEGPPVWVCDTARSLIGKERGRKD